MFNNIEYVLLCMDFLKLLCHNFGFMHQLLRARATVFVVVRLFFK